MNSLILPKVFKILKYKSENIKNLIITYEINCTIVKFLRVLNSIKVQLKNLLTSKLFSE